MQEARTLFDYYLSIPIGKCNAVSRAHLCREWGTNDRTVRAIIADIRADCVRLGMEYYVVSDSHGKGYWRTRDMNEIEEFNNQMMSRVKRIIPAVRNAESFIGKAVQEDLFGGLYR